MMKKSGRSAAPESEATTLASLPFGVSARVLSIVGTSTMARRLMEMGLVPGAPVCAVKAAPLGDPIEICVRGYNLALRRAEAESIRVAVAARAEAR